MILKKYSTKNSQDVADLQAFDALLRVDVGFQGSPAVVDSDSVLYATDRTLLMPYSSKDNSYKMELSLFLQQLAAPVEQKTKYRTFVLHPAAQGTANNPDAQSGLKTVNRVVFPKNKIKLKIFYTKPTAAR